MWWVHWMKWLQWVGDDVEGLVLKLTKTWGQLSSAQLGPFIERLQWNQLLSPSQKGTSFLFFFFTVFIQFHKQKVCLYLSQIILHSSFTFFLYIYKKNHYSKCQSTVSFDNVCTSCSHLIKQRLSQTFEISFIIILFCTN